MTIFLTFFLGGLSHLSNRYGFSADNVLSFEVVLANATSVTADKVLHSDLYWALKGGSNNFGTPYARDLFSVYKRMTEFSANNRHSDPHDIEGLCSWEGMGWSYHVQ